MVWIIVIAVVVFIIIMMIKKVLLMNPPVGVFQRGEERCQADVEGGTAISLRPPNNLGYLMHHLRLVFVWSY